MRLFSLPFAVSPLRSLLLSAAVAAFAAVSCGGSDASPDEAPAPSPPPPVPLDQLGAKLAAVRCDVERSCQPVVFDDQYASVDDCRAQKTEKFAASRYPLLKAGVEAGRAAYDGSKAPSCLDKIKATKCDAPEADPFQGLCPEMWQGKVAVDGACMQDADCADLSCDTVSTCPGTCKPRGGDGAHCFNDNGCFADFYCKDYECAPRAKLGEACGHDKPDCPADAFCAGGYDPDKPGAYGTCLQRKDAYPDLKEGDACGAYDSYRFCAPGLACVFSPDGSGKQVCAAKVASGAACAPSGSNESVCPGGEFCNDGVCTPQRGEGEDCTFKPAYSGQICARGLVCNTSKKCQKPGKAGAPCDDNFECYGYCPGDNCLDRTGCEM